MNKVGIIGSSGRVGKQLIKKGCVSLDCDIRDIGSIEKAITLCKPDVIVSLAAKSSPEWCEQKENFQEMFDVNVRGVHNLGEITQKLAIPTIIISTDHIFSGRSYFDWGLKKWIKSGAYSEDYSRPVSVNQYGVSKLAAETMAFMYDNMKIVRTSYLFDAERLSEHFNDAALVHSQKFYPSFIYRSFMHTEHFVDNLLYYVDNVYKMPSILHISGSKTLSWNKFIMACLDKKDMQINIRIYKKDNKELVSRPHKAGLKTGLSAKLGFPQYSYLDGLELL